MKTRSQPEPSVKIATAETATGIALPGRRHVLTAAGAGLVAAAALGSTASASPSAAPSASGVSGGWLATRHDKSSSVPIRSVFTFANGGAAVGLDLEPTAPPYLGSWEAQDAYRFTFTFWTPIIDDSGVSIGTGRVKAIGRLDGDRISGSYTAVIFLQGQRAHDSGTFAGMRIDPS